MFFCVLEVFRLIPSNYLHYTAIYGICQALCHNFFRFFYDFLCMDFYERIKVLVKKKGCSLIEFVQSLGISYDKYESLKRYNNLPRADEAFRIARALGVTIEYLITGNESSGLSDDALSLARKLPSLSPSQLAVLNATADTFIASNTALQDAQDAAVRSAVDTSAWQAV